jgi:hypothetical protein
VYKCNNFARTFRVSEGKCKTSLDWPPDGLRVLWEHGEIENVNDSLELRNYENYDELRADGTASEIYGSEDILGN